MSRPDTARVRTALTALTAAAIPTAAWRAVSRRVDTAAAKRHAQLLSELAAQRDLAEQTRAQLADLREHLDAHPQRTGDGDTP